MMMSNNSPGFVIATSTIAVDYWPKKDNDHITHYFLTHCHTDHTANLDSTWKESHIYCSPMSKRLLHSLNNVPEDNIIALDLEKTYVMKLDEEETFNVTLINANHCPGAVMLLFEGYFGVVLATGDFRYDPSMFIESPLVNKEIDTCYLDNTYFNPVFRTMPSRDQAMLEIKRVIDHCRKRLEAEKCLFKIKLKRLGKEEILVNLAEHYKTHVLVTKERYNRLVNVLELPEHYFKVEADSNTFLCVVELNKASSDFNFSLLNSKQEIVIEPSALVMANQAGKQLRTRQSISPDCDHFRIAYSDHSSYSEICEFVQNLRPKRIVPIVNRMVNDNVCVANLNELDRFLSKKPLVNGSDRFKLLLKSETSVRRSARIMSHKISCENEPSRSNFRDSAKQSTSSRKQHTTIARAATTTTQLVASESRFVTFRRLLARKAKTQIDYDDSAPESDPLEAKVVSKDSPFRRTTLESPHRMIRLNSGGSNRRVSAPRKLRIQSPSLAQIAEEPPQAASNTSCSDTCEYASQSVSLISAKISDANEKEEKKEAAAKPVEEEDCIEMSSTSGSDQSQAQDQTRTIVTRVLTRTRPRSLSPLDNHQTLEKKNSNKRISLQLKGHQTQSKNQKTRTPKSPRLETQKENDPSTIDEKIPANKWQQLNSQIEITFSEEIEGIQDEESVTEETHTQLPAPTQQPFVLLHRLNLDMLPSPKKRVQLGLSSSVAKVVKPSETASSALLSQEASSQIPLSVTAADNALAHDLDSTVVPNTIDSANISNPLNISDNTDHLAEYAREKMTAMKRAEKLKQESQEFLLFAKKYLKFDQQQQQSLSLTDTSGNKSQRDLLTKNILDYVFDSFKF